MKTISDQRIKEDFDILYSKANQIAEHEANLYIVDFQHQIDELSLDEQILRIQKEKQLLIKKMDDFEAEVLLNLDSKSDLYKVFASQIFSDAKKEKEKQNKKSI